MPVVTVASIGVLLIQGVVSLIKRRRSFVGGIRDVVQRELTDPLRFFIGALLVLVLGRRDRWGKVRMALAFWVAVAAAAAPVLGALLAGLNALAYGLTVFLAGILTLIPERLYELRKEGAIRGVDYPFSVKRVILVVDVVCVVVAAGVIGLWKFGGPDLHASWRGATWGVLTVAIADIATFVACVEMGVVHFIVGEDPTSDIATIRHQTATILQQSTPDDRRPPPTEAEPIAGSG